VTYVLYSTSACHLCELAKGVVAQLQDEGQAIVLREVDISESDVLFERYGVRIPVLQAPDGRELGWPFDKAGLRVFLG
jgi:hypothetical protein